MRGGRAFTKLAFPIGGNVNGILNSDPTAIASLQACGMTYSRLQLGWNADYGAVTGFEMTVGSYNSSAAASVASVVATHKAAGITPIMIVNTYGASSPGWSGLCPFLNTALVSGNVYTSLSISTNGFALAVGDSIQLTWVTFSGSTPTYYNQTVVCQSTVAANTLGPTTINVTSFTANANYSISTWVYDTAWPPCTPLHLANGMAWLVAQSGLTGLRWEVLNEPDGGDGWPNNNISALMYAQLYKLLYPAMKAADPTCILHGFCMESLSPTGLGFGDGCTWYLACISHGILGNYDCISVHMYSAAPTGSPDGYDANYHMTMPQLMSNFRSIMLANSDSVPIWITECGWAGNGTGYSSPQSQAQYFQNWLLDLNGHDPVNNVAYSSYVAGFLVWVVTDNQGTEYALYPTDSTPNPAVAILAELVTGH